ncbi:mechanosensitive ion channel domain-containing protein [Burkholderia gladioli]|uniref:mechanosensitive ion channel domain-containing protein n=1 Tax=Burkholderia gladioli TaxID=28095 RepID=UPI001641D1B7|nr:mechanosensitive ion channel family protein [Burkholderia gladioli]
MKYPLIVASSIVAADILVWRARLPPYERTRLFIRLALFAALSWLLFSADMSPFGEPPYRDAAGLHWLAQILEIIWWLMGARLLTLSLDLLLLPRSWRKQRLFSDVFGAIVFLAATVAALAFVLGLAIQSTLSDVFAGIVLSTTEPYSVGDWVVIDDVEGMVVEMNWRATHLLTGQGNTLVVPNALTAKAKISNNSRPAKVHGLSLVLEIAPEARPRTVLDALERALTGCHAILRSPAAHARVQRATLNSIHYEVVGFVDDMALKRAASNELFDLCYRHLAAAGVPLRALGVPAPAAEAGDARQALLKRVSLFESLDAAEVAQLAKRLSRHEYRANQEILAPDTVPDSLAIVDTGVLSVVFREASGERELARVGPGEAFGEAGLLAGLPMRVSITTLTPAVLFQLGKDDMSAFLKAHPEVAEKLCQLLAYRQDKLGKLTAALPAEQEHGHSLFDWLFGKMRHVHALHD